MTPTTWFILILAIMFLMTSFMVLLAKNLVVIITSIGLGSAIIAILFFIFDAPYAGAFELSVGAGLISVFFIIATSVTDRAADVEE